MKKYIKYLYIIIPVIILIAGLFYFLNNKAEKNISADEGVKSNVISQKAPDIKTATTTTSVAGYEIEFTRSVDNDSIGVVSKISIKKGGKIVFGVKEDQDFSGFFVGKIGDWIESADDLKKKAIKDITGNGIPELYVDGYSGGAHCCSHSYIVELSNPISILLDLDTGDYGVEFKDLNNDGIKEILTYDDVFSYWHSSFAGSPRPSVILSLQDGKYKADPKFMRKPALTDAEVKEMANNLESMANKDDIYPDVAWRIYAIDLIYSGNIASARKYVDLVWSPNNAGDFGTKEKFWQELDDQIKKSPYYKDLSSFLKL